ncbi:hypothetical protein JXZ92_01105 [Mycoplasma sp. CSL10137]|uniref:hypothetical protein n=1 Tax=unclassified Mycoplasma TaxID=2683645 RepID=UPI00197B6147|nr:MULTISPECIES: hypothetical protein [unclassified Mycoplasma]MBN4083420.1 hypothetical protein [Mycoplasma sp. CSL10137]MBU4692735.1 hypothetical protein [Mycoplasma sp. CSL7491-lung]
MNNSNLNFKSEEQKNTNQNLSTFLGDRPLLRYLDNKLVYSISSETIQSLKEEQNSIEEFENTKKNILDNIFDNIDEKFVRDNYTKIDLSIKKSIKHKKLSITFLIFFILFMLSSIALILFAFIPNLNNIIQSVAQGILIIYYGVIPSSVLAILFMILTIVFFILKRRNTKIAFKTNEDIERYAFELIKNKTYNIEEIKKIILNNQNNVKYLDSKGAIKHFNLLSYPDISHQNKLVDVGLCEIYTINNHLVEIQNLDVIENNNLYDSTSYTKIQNETARDAIKPIINSDIKRLVFYKFVINNEKNIPNFSILNHFNIINEGYEISLVPTKTQSLDINIMFKLRSENSINDDEKNNLIRALENFKNNKLFGQGYAIESSSIYAQNNNLYALLAYKDSKDDDVLVLNNEYLERIINNDHEINDYTSLSILNVIDDLVVFSLHLSNYYKKATKPILELIDNM